MIRLNALAMVGAMLSGVEAFPCSAATISMNVTTPDELQNMIKTVNCTGEGTFEVSWIGSLQLHHSIGLSGNKTLTVTGPRADLTIFPSAVVDAESATGIFRVSNGSTLILKNLGLQGGASENGAAVDARSFSSVHVADCAFTNNTSSTGGGIT